MHCTVNAVSRHFVFRPLAHDCSEWHARRVTKAGMLSGECFWSDYGRCNGYHIEQGNVLQLRRGRRRLSLLPDPV